MPLKLIMPPWPLQQHSGCDLGLISAASPAQRSPSSPPPLPSFLAQPILIRQQFIFASAFPGRALFDASMISSSSSAASLSMAASSSASSVSSVSSSAPSAPSAASLSASSSAATTATQMPVADSKASSHHAVGESAFAKFFVSGTVALTFELSCGHFLEFLKIAKQTTGKPYLTLARNMVEQKGLIGVLDGFFPWGALQCFVKGASFGAGHAAGRTLMERHRDTLQLSPFTAEVLSGGFGGLTQGIVMSPLLLLKTRVMTQEEMRGLKGMWATVAASSKMGVKVVRDEGVAGLMKGSLLFSAKRVADWTTRYYFAELVSEMARRHQRVNKLTLFDETMCSLLGGALSATATIPLDVLVANVQDAKRAGQKVSVVKLMRERLNADGVNGLFAYSTRGFVARVLHVGATTALMKSISSAVLALWSKSSEVGSKPRVAS